MVAPWEGIYGKICKVNMLLKSKWSCVMFFWLSLINDDVNAIINQSPKMKEFFFTSGVTSTCLPGKPGGPGSPRLPSLPCEETSSNTQLQPQLSHKVLFSFLNLKTTYVGTCIALVPLQWRVKLTQVIGKGLDGSSKFKDLFAVVSFGSSLSLWEKSNLI